MLLQFIIIGAQKSASTFIHTCVREHPDVYMPEGETSYFESPDFENTPVTEFEKQFDKHNDKLIGIKRPNYLGIEYIPRRLKETNPETKIIIVLRSPIKRIISAYYHYMKGGYIPVLNIEKGLRKLLNNKYKESHKRAEELLEYGLYFKHITNYFNHFDKKNVLILWHNDIVSNKLAEIKKVFDFLQLDNSFVPESLNKRPQAAIYNLFRIRLIQIRNFLSVNYNAEKTRTIIHKNLFKKFIYNSYNYFDKHMLAKIFKSKKPKISKELFDKILTYYDNDINSLEAFFEKDLNNWKNSSK
jgi:Sulfotransferase domain